MNTVIDHLCLSKSLSLSRLIAKTQMTSTQVSQALFKQHVQDVNMISPPRTSLTFPAPTSYPSRNVESLSTPSSEPHGPTYPLHLGTALPSLQLLLSGFSPHSLSPRPPEAAPWRPGPRASPHIPTGTAAPGGARRHTSSYFTLLMKIFQRLVPNLQNKLGPLG